MIIGHSKQWDFLKKVVFLERLPHAFLFSGPEHLGKRKIALEFVKFIFCQEKNFSKKPCGFCPSCFSLEKGVHPDLILLENPLSREIGISEIREIIRKLSLKPYLAPLKIAVIDKAHLMTREAQNCFLKTLEEPKGKTLLILITNYPLLLLPTILSRVQEMRFFPVNKEEIKKFLLKNKADPKEAELIIRYAGPKPGKAIEFFLDKEKREKHKKIIKDLETILRSDLSYRFDYVKKISLEEKKEGGVLFFEILEVWLAYFREFLFEIVREENKNKRNYPLKKIKKIIPLIQNIYYLISSTNVNKRLAMEILMMHL